MKELQGVEEMWLADLRITNVRKSGAGLSFGKIFGGSSLGGSSFYAPSSPKSLKLVQRQELTDSVAL